MNDGYQYGGRMPPTTNRHELRRQATRRALRDAALAMFAERGFTDVTVGEIADAVGVTERTFYRHFATKEAVLFQDFEQRLDWLAAALDIRPPTESLIEAVRAASRSYPDAVEVVRQGALLRSSLITEQLAAEHLRIIEAAFAAEFQDHFRKRHADHAEVDLLAAVAANALAGALVAVVDVWGQRGCVDDITAMVDRALDFVAAGLELADLR
jgi:AcrR family transcriptional regulator